MFILRRTTPVAMAVAAGFTALVGTFEAVDGVFGNPHLITSAGSLIRYIIRSYFLYGLNFFPLLFIINLLLCVFFPGKMRKADYARLLQYFTGLTLFILTMFVYVWITRANISEAMRERQGIPAKLFYWSEMAGFFGLISYMAAATLHRFVSKPPPGRMVLYISSIVWFALLLPLAGEVVILLLIPGWHPLLQLTVLVLIAVPVCFAVRHLNRLTMALTGLNKKAWVAFGSVIVLLLIGWGALATLKPSPGYPPRAGGEMNILLISVDALRADHLGCYGYEPDNPFVEPGEFTPNIDAIAEDGLLFERAYSTSSWTLASVSSWMTGGWPSETGGTFINKRIFKSLTTLPEALREEGYACAAFTANPFLGPETAIGRGFSRYWEFFNAQGMSRGLFIDKIRFWLINRLDVAGMMESGRWIVGEQMKRVYEWLRENRRAKFFLWVHLYDPHSPYTPPKPYENQIPDIGGKKRQPQYRTMGNWRTGTSHHNYGLRRHIVNLYDAEIRFSDEVVGGLMAQLDELGLSGNTMVIFTSDHGEEFFDHGKMEHGHTQYNELLHVPLIFRLPGKVPQGRRLDDKTSLIDLFPTILEFTGASVEPKLYRGASLARSIYGGDMSYAGIGDMSLTPPGAPSAAPVFGRALFSEDMFYFDHDLKSITMGDWKLIHSKNRFHDERLWDPGITGGNQSEYGARHFVEGDELYDLSADPMELKNVIYDYPEIARQLRDYLERIDEENARLAEKRKEKEGKMTFFGEGLKGLTKGFGYW